MSSVLDLKKFMLKNEEGAIYPKKGRRDPQVAPDVVMVMVRSQLDRLTAGISARKMAFSEAHLYNLYEARFSSGGSISISGPFFGAPHAVVGIEKLIALGAERIWVLGWCGALDPRLSIGDIILPRKAFSEEGTSPLYANGPIEPVADDSLFSQVEISLGKKQIPATKGPIWTTDGLYRETPSKIRAYRELGALAVEMELSALMSVANFRSVALAALLVVSDELSPSGWHPGFSDPRLRKADEVAGSVLIELAAHAG
jgi:uridine phosphorylase